MEKFSEHNQFGENHNIPIYDYTTDKITFFSSDTNDNDSLKEKNVNEDKYENVNHPNHYNNYDVEVIEMMERIWGPEKTAIFCELNAFKYRMRMGTKPTSPIEEDLDKERWYLEMKHILINKVNYTSLKEGACAKTFSL